MVVVLVEGGVWCVVGGGAWWCVVVVGGGDPHLHYGNEEGPTLGVSGGEGSYPSLAEVIEDTEDFM